MTAWTLSLATYPRALMEYLSPCYAAGHRAAIRQAERYGDSAPTGRCWSCLWLLGRGRVAPPASVPLHAHIQSSGGLLVVYLPVIRVLPRLCTAAGYADEPHEERKEKGVAAVSALLVRPGYLTGHRMRVFRARSPLGEAPAGGRWAWSLRQCRRRPGTGAPQPVSASRRGSALLCFRLAGSRKPRAWCARWP